VLGSLRGGVAVVDQDLKVLVWNQHANDLWGLRSDEAIGHHLLGLDVGLPIERLKQPLFECLSGSRSFIELQLESTNRRGRTIQCLVTCSPLLGAQQQVRGVIIMMEDLDAQSTTEPRRDGRAKKTLAEQHRR